MHALSSDTRLIYVLTISLFDNFDQDLQWSLENFINTSDYERLEGLHQKLSQVSYTLEDSELLALVQKLFPRLPDVNFDDIANHYGWSKVDERRSNFIIKHVVSYAFDEAFEETST